MLSKRSSHRANLLQIHGMVQPISPTSSCYGRHWKVKTVYNLLISIRVHGWVRHIPASVMTQQQKCDAWTLGTACAMSKRFESGILFRPIKTDTHGARRVISELNATLPEFTELSKISSRDVIIEVIDAVLKCHSYVDPYLRMHHELMTQHLPSQKGLLESRRNYFQCFIAGWMLDEYAKRIPDQRLNMLFMVYLRLFHRFSRKGSVHEDNSSNGEDSSAITKAASVTTIGQIFF